MSFSIGLIASATLASAAPIPVSAFFPPDAPTVPAAAPQSEASYERVAEVLVSAMICQAFGYSLDREGLGDWTGKQITSLADQTDGYDREDAVLRVNRSATPRYWFVRNRYEGAFALVNQTGFYNSRRFVSRYRDECADLARSSDAGNYVARAREEPDTLELLGQVRKVMLSKEVVQRFKRAYPPYLGRSIGRP